MKIRNSVRLECGHTVINREIQLDLIDIELHEQRDLYNSLVLDDIPIIGLDCMYCNKCNCVKLTKSFTIYLVERDIPTFS